MTGVFRTPGERFAGLPDFPFEPEFRVVDELRVAHLDVGDGSPVVMLHGEPTWSFVWRKAIPPVRDAGYRCVVPDHAGFGRSDKPMDPAWHSLRRHVAVTRSLLEELELRDVTLVVHDWGGPIGVTVALALPERVSRVVILDTAIDPRETWMSDAWVRFREFVERTEDLPVGEMMRTSCFSDLGDDVLAAYDAPFPTLESKAATRGLPMSVPAKDDRVAAAEAETLYDRLRRDPRPMLTIWAELDFILPLSSGQRLASRIGRQIDHVVPEAGHGLLEDQGVRVGQLIADWLTGLAT
jgi:haloalkane dehalogenase